MFDIGWTELLVVGVVALIVVGPKDLPVMFRTLGQFTAKARAMAREFQRAMDDAADSTGVKDIASDLRKMSSGKSMGLDELDKLRKWDPMRPDSKDKSAKDGPAEGPRAEDEAAADEIDDIAAEMEAMRQSRAQASQTGASPSRGAPAVPAEPSAGKASPDQTPAPTGTAAHAAPTGTAAKPRPTGTVAKAAPTAKGALDTTAATSPAAARKTTTRTAGVKPVKAAKKLPADPSAPAPAKPRKSARKPSPAAGKAPDA